MGKYVIKQAKSGPMFNLKARNGEIIGTSEIYTSLDACKNGIASVQKNAPVMMVLLSMSGLPCIIMLWSGSEVATLMWCCSISLL